ncbi:MAG: hypothetical protein K940chlam8_00774 [Chlamydiae bacterium]|nr:hypothetical protein [Chlamydiota bacterium]
MYRPETLKNILVSDNTFHIWAKAVNPNCNVVRWIPWIDFEHYAYKGPSDYLEMGCYIVGFQHVWPNEFKQSTNFVEHYKINFNIPINFTVTNGVSQKELPNVMHNTIATLHIKSIEGFGYSILESLACGRPVFLCREFAKGKRYTTWCIEGKTAFYFDTAEEFCQKLHKFVVDKEYRHFIQETTARTVREIINNEEQAQILQTFLDNLQ